MKYNYRVADHVTVASLCGNRLKVTVERGSADFPVIKRRAPRAPAAAPQPQAPNVVRRRVAKPERPVRFLESESLDAIRERVARAAYAGRAARRATAAAAPHPPPPKVVPGPMPDAPRSGLLGALLRSGCAPPAPFEAPAPDPPSPVAVAAAPTFPDEPHDTAPVPEPSSAVSAAHATAEVRDVRDAKPEALDVPTHTTAPAPSHKTAVSVTWPPPGMVTSRATKCIPPFFKVQLTMCSGSSRHDNTGYSLPVPTAFVDAYMTPSQYEQRTVVALVGEDGEVPPSATFVALSLSAAALCFGGGGGGQGSGGPEVEWREAFPRVDGRGG